MYNCGMLPMLRHSVVLALALFACHASAQTAPFTPEIKAKIDAAVQKVLQDTDTPSAQIGVAEGGRVVFTAAYGMARIEPAAPATVEMKYGIGSVSKQFTAAAVMLLVERGKLRLDDPVSTWFPDVEHAKAVTLRMLLNQVSGYSDYYTEDYLTPELATPADPVAMMKRWTSKPLDFAPGTKWQYSNTNYLLAALIVQKVAGEPFFKFLTDNVLHPAGLTHVIDLGGGEVPVVPQGYVHFGFGPPRATPREAAGTVFGAGELAMPIGELLLWDTVVMKRKVLKPTSWQVMQAEFDLPDGSGDGYGMGYFLEARDDRRVIEHSGGLNGFTTLNQIYPDQNVAIGVLINSDTATRPILRAIEDVIFAPAAAAPVKTDAKADALVRTVLGQLAQGRIDRALLRPNLDFFFTDQVLADYKSSLAPLGEIKSLETLEAFERGGMYGWVYRVQGTAGKPIRALVYITKDGKLDQILLRK